MGERPRSGEIRALTPAPGVPNRVAGRSVKDPSKVVDLFPLLGVGVAVGIQTASPYVTAAVSGGFTWTLPPYTLAQ